MSLYRDFDFSCKLDNKTGIQFKDDIDAIKQSLLNILLTERGEVFFDPLFGTNLNKLLFEKMTIITKLRIKDEIIFAIENFEPRVKIDAVQIEDDFEYLTWNINIIYHIIALDSTDNLELNLRLQGI